MKDSSTFPNPFKSLINKQLVVSYWRARSVTRKQKKCWHYESVNTAHSPLLADGWRCQIPSLVPARPGQGPVSALPWLLARFPRCLLFPRLLLLDTNNNTASLICPNKPRNILVFICGNFGDLISIVCVQYQDQHILYWEVLVLSCPLLPHTVPILEIDTTFLSDFSQRFSAEIYMKVKYSSNIIRGNNNI